MDDPQDYDLFIFNWFNDRDPDEMKRCLDAWDEAKRTPATPKETDHG